MAKLSAHGAELFRYFSISRRCLMAAMEDGTTLYKTPYSGWKVFARKKADVPLEQWRRGKEEMVSKLPEWARKCKSIPSVSALERWSYDGICETPTGETVEPDGIGTDGVPSWTLIFGFI